ncbi:DUF4399 domain-containing protein [Herbaspirillum sp. YR522]|uniref:DUF4399 domain-containing protein n=1 Tax=Herbaspirillum sp. YR522 TaxID=1144342 RepID=UPI00026F5C0A|nr:DUF4399 domain-containing protein [Herbaspirillum sp. YR522]EJN10206.1 hypothetical protein PMI40_00168 [Herbaspirillum sp. YR522]
MQTKIISLSRSVVLAGAGLLLAGAAGGAWADEPSLSILEPKGGATVTSPFKVRLAAHSMTTGPAGKLVPNTGHHHLLINEIPIGKGKVIPNDKTHIHLDQGQTETELSLPPGKYKLTAQFADGEHRAYGYMMVNGINITVK